MADCVSSPAILIIFIEIPFLATMARPPGTLSTRLRLLFVFLFVSGFVGVRAQQFSINKLPATCGQPNGEITIVIDQVSFGNGPYTIVISDLTGPVATVVTTFNTYSFTGLAGGQNYVFDVSNAGMFASDYTYLEDIGGVSAINPVTQPASCLNNDGSVILNPVGGYPPYAYSFNGGPFSSQNNVGNLPNGNIPVAVRDDDGCVTSTTVLVPLNDDLTVSVASVLPSCQGTPVVLQGATNGTSFQWSDPAGLSDPSSLTPTATPAASTLYTLTATRGPAGVCPAKSASVFVTVSPAPVPDAGPDQYVCAGKNIGLYGNGGKTYTWTPTTYLVNPGSQNVIVAKPDSTITYALSVVDNKGCHSLVSDSVTVYVTPPFKVIGSPADTIVYAGQPVPLTATADVDTTLTHVTYQWDPFNGLSNPYAQSTTAVLTEPQIITYTVLATTDEGCTGKDTITVKVFAVADILVPNAFTPNGDGHNDILRPVIPGIKELKVFAVYGRFGQQVFTTSNPSVGWDGSVNGRRMESGTYVWMAVGVDVAGRTIERRGTVVLIR